MRIVRTPLVLVGILLVAVGLGNWYTGVDKTTAYEQLLAAGETAPQEQQLDDFRQLDAQTAAMLARTMQRSRDGHTLADAKLDFYNVVRSGGRLLILLGLFCAAAGLIQSWHRHRLSGRAPAPQRGS